MTYQIKHGDVLNANNCIIVHGTNCCGVMGAGVAYQIKNRFPEVYDAYIEKYKSKQTKYNTDNGSNLVFDGLKLGEISYGQVGPFKFIVNANTQFNCGTDKRYADYEAIAKCFENVKILHTEIYAKTGLKLDIVFPMIGAGLAGGNWNIIETIILETLGNEFIKILYKFP